MVALVIAEHDNTNVKGSTLNTITAACQCDNEVHVLVVGNTCKSVAEQVSKINGVTRVLIADDTQFAHALAENVAAQALSIASRYSYVLAPATAFGKAILPRVAACLDIAQISEITKVITSDTFERPIYAGNAIATVQSSDKILAITVRTTSFDPAVEGGNAIIEPIHPIVDTEKSTFISRKIAKSDRPELISATRVVSGGRGMGSSEAFKIIEPLADTLGAGMGASRAAVDAGYAPNDWQIGQTGKIVAPELYIAVGISGAIQHLAGMKDSKTIVAINKDAEAPIFGVADYGIVGDLFEIVPKFVAELG